MNRPFSCMVAIGFSLILWMIILFVAVFFLQRPW
jgi:hypothetical protein